MSSAPFSPPAGLTLASMLYPASLCAFMVRHGLSKKSLSHSGAAAATIVGLGTFTHTPYVFSVALLSFYLSSSRLTKFKSQAKKKLEEDHQEGGARTAIQVFSNGATGTAIALLFQYVYWNQASRPVSLFLEDWRASVLLFAYLGHYACCNGDTWASELGILNKSWPTLITTLKKVPPGTNGGVSTLGLGASVAGGFFIGIASALSLIFQQLAEAQKNWAGIGAFANSLNGGFLFSVIFAATAAGLFGSLLDSFLGATVQKSSFSTKKNMITYKTPENGDEIKDISGIDLLDNHQVNFVSSLLTALATGYFAWRFLW
ncbi:Transmembrane protein 19 [Lunasporangiospora selenospora]|uniref:Transmembrane protein 19 n=1 Tax=Lunasporangiospora selenospora TaxID=979761 RepID=A0A9P6KD67_9FUNG|nr:Transmembrane protein 19 [Lunasporangiospora selenospora]